MNNKGKTLYKLGRYHDCLKYFDKAIEINPKYVDAWTNKGNAFYNLGRYDEAIIYFDKAIEIDTNYADAWYSKGLCYSFLKKYEESIECFSKVIDLKVNLDWAYLCRGESYYNRGYYIEALEDFKKIKNLNLYDIKCNNIGLCYYQLGLYGEAENQYIEAIKSNKQSSNVYYNLAVLYTNQNKNRTAKRILQNDRTSFSIRSL